MSYQVIARKYRPQSFQEIVGQKHITQTLNNALKNNRIPHAILFTGPRGTGKTSSARILAKALRCPNSVTDANGALIPCGQCDSCIEIAESRSVDVIEIDGASNNGVDSIRELRETVGYMPSQGKFKIFIIDEVHMLSGSAFNALLKTLEEPPDHIIFIMATTEVHKIPQTILSRCQRFDFRRISLKEISDHLAQICQAENIVFEPEALWLIAKQGDGSMRDSQSLLDQVISFSNGPLTKSKTQEILGLTDRHLLFETLSVILDRSPRHLVELLKKMRMTATDPELFMTELVELARHLLVVKTAGVEALSIVEIPESEFQELASFTQKASSEDIHHLFDLLLKATQDLAKSQDAYIVLEVLLLRLANSPRIEDLHTLLKGLNSTPATTPYATMAATPAPATSRAASVVQPAPPRSIPLGSNASVSVSVSTTTLTPTPTSTAVRPTPPPPPASGFVTGKTPEDRWLALIDRVRAADPLFGAKLENLIFVKEDVKKLMLGVSKTNVFLKDLLSDSENKKKMQGFVDSFWGSGYSFTVSASGENQGASAQVMVQKKTMQSEELVKQKIMSDPKVLAAQRVFNGTVKSVTEIKSDAKK
ncbi:MAG: DNA polymerase III subunit gamma/tau [Bdellovibrionaceae bacterium]|nr:DNA polymerase III subunit gamma/tau [Pseudobdellovibrionaceae bacterium]